MFLVLGIVHIIQVVPWNGSKHVFSASVVHSKQDLEDREIVCTLEAEKLIKSTDGV